jgi:hypothetical protein
MLLLFTVTSFNASAQQVKQDDLEEILLTQLHKQISEAIKDTYDVAIVQYNTPEIVSIKKEYLPESSEELKPGKTYELTLKVNVVNVKDKQKNLLIVFSNNTSDGEFMVTEIKKE